jgi:hypothetical protein
MFIRMDTPASKLIDAFGGTSKTARIAGLPISTVHSWRRNGIPQSRLSHLGLVAKTEKPDLDFDRLAVGVTPPPKPTRKPVEQTSVAA